MKKTLKVISGVGLIAGVILYVKKATPRWYRYNVIPPEDNLAADVKEKVEHIARKGEHVVKPFTDLERTEALREARNAFAALLAAKESNDVPENINYVEDLENNARVFNLGTAEGELVPFSDEYKAIINSAYEESLKDENFELRFFGSTYGIGTKGRENKDGSKVFGKNEIAKLKNKLEK